MEYKTEVNWGRPLNEAEMEQVVRKLGDDISKSKTDGERYETQGLGPLGITIERHWATEEDAKDFIDFLKTFNPPLRNSRISKL